MKVSQIKSKVAAKVAKGKSKVAAKCGKAAKCASLVFCLASLALAGCQNPAQRAQTAETSIYIYEGATVTFGSDFVSLAQSNETGGNDAGLTASPTNTTDVRPDVDINTTGGRTAGVLESIVAAFGTWLTTPSGQDSVEKFASGNCTNGGNCADVSSECSKCSRTQSAK